jgi:hypothetical protein
MLHKKPKILFVTYGGGHVRMIMPVIVALQEYPIDIQVIALTGSYKIFQENNIPCKSFKDYLDPTNTEAIKWGKTLASEMQNTSIPIDETIAYLGLSFTDLIDQLGEKKAVQAYKEKQRHAFLPIHTLKKIINDVQPDLVVTTNSPRAERAAIMVAKERGIPTLSLSDLFCLSDFFVMESDVVTVLDKQAMTNLKKSGVKSNIVVTGNPSFDGLLPKRHFFKDIVAEGLLWVDSPATWDLSVKKLYSRSDEEIVGDLDSMKEAAMRNNLKLLIRAHPSQNIALFADWVERQNSSDISLVHDIDLLDLLAQNLIVSGYSSTVLLQAVFVGRVVVQIAYQGRSGNLPLGDLGLAWLVREKSELFSIISEAYSNDERKEALYNNFHNFFSLEPATPKIVDLILKMSYQKPII